MSTQINHRQPARGRQVPNRRSPLLPFYVLLGAIAVIGVVVIGVVAVRGSAATTPTTTATVPAPINAPTGTTSDGFYYKGSPDAPVKVIEYADFQCPACGQFATTMEGSINSAYIESGKVQLIYHEFPLPQHTNAVISAEAARSAGAQGKFWQMHDLLFARQSEWEGLSDPRAQFVQYAALLGLNTTTFSNALANGTYANAVQSALSASESAGIQQTPTFVVDGKQVLANQLQAAIDAALQAAGH